MQSVSKTTKGKAKAKHNNEQELHADEREEGTDQEEE